MYTRDKLYTMSVELYLRFRKCLRYEDLRFMKYMRFKENKGYYEGVDRRVVSLFSWFVKMAELIC